MPLYRTSLFDWHASHGGRIVEFGGWEMPVQYTSIVEEHHAVRKAVGVFDISHMGRLTFQGTDAQSLLNELLTCRVDNLVDGQIRYGLVCNTAGGILDDVLVNRIHATSFGLVVNASNREKIVDWIAHHTADANVKKAAGLLDVVVADQTQETAMFAIQGPNALALVNQIAKIDLTSMKYYTGRAVEMSGKPVFASRTGYTGEDGFEFVIPSSMAEELWNEVIATGQPLGIKPCGLGSRDTLRLEAAMPLYGHELSETIDPIMAGLGFAVKLDKPTFVGRESLLKIHEKADCPVRVGLKLASRRIAREHSELFVGPDRIGEVTSGTFSPTLERSVAMAYVAARFSMPATEIEVDIRGKREPATVVKLPFCQRARS